MERGTCVYNSNLNESKSVLKGANDNGTFTALFFCTSPNLAHSGDVCGGVGVPKPSVLPNTLHGRRLPAVVVGGGNGVRPLWNSGLRPRQGDV